MKAILKICIILFFINNQANSWIVGSIKEPINNIKVLDTLTLVADFSSDAVEVCPEKFIQFSDNSAGEIIEWKWYFEGGVPSTLSEQNPLVYYPESGCFDVSLIVMDEITSDTLYVNDFIYIIEIPAITFDELPEFCNNDPAYELFEGHPLGGEYSGTGVLFGHFVPAIAEVGSHTLSYYYMDENGCGDTAFQVCIVSACTGVEDTFFDFQVNIYPNPAKDKLIVECEGEYLNKAKLEICNSNGVSIFKTEYEIFNPQSKTEILISDWTPGMYLLLVYNNEKVQKLKKFIVL